MDENENKKIEKKSLKQMKDTMDKLEEAHNMTNEKRIVIESKENELREEIRPVVLEEKKEEIKKLKEAKAEFDEMTVNALVNMKRDILTKRDELDNKYQQELLDFQDKRQKAEKEKDDLKEKIIQAKEKAFKMAMKKEREDKLEPSLDSIENSINTAVENLEKKIEEKDKEIDNYQKGMARYQRNYFNNVTKLDNWDKRITEYAEELDAVEELDKVTIDGKIGEAKGKDKDKDKEGNDIGENPASDTGRDEGENTNTGTEGEEKEDKEEEKTTTDEDGKEEGEEENPSGIIDGDEKEDTKGGTSTGTPTRGTTGGTKEPEKDETTKTEGEGKEKEEKSGEGEPVKTDETTEEPKDSSTSTDNKKKDPLFTLRLGNTGVLTYEGEEYTVDLKTIKGGLALNNKAEDPVQYEELVEELEERGLPENIISAIGVVDGRYTPIDFSVLLAINESEIPSDKKQELMESYICNVIKSQHDAKVAFGKETTEEENYISHAKWQPMDITYDMDDLSKPLPFLKTLFSLHPEKHSLTQNEKLQMKRLANKTFRYGLGKGEGEYNYDDNSLKAKILRFFKKTRNLLPAPKDMRIVEENEEIIDYRRDAAKIYNDAYDKTTEVLYEDKDGKIRRTNQKTLKSKSDSYREGLKVTQITHKDNDLEKFDKAIDEGIEKYNEGDTSEAHKQRVSKEANSLKDIHDRMNSVESDDRDEH